jgi:metallophosphoesterase (TIGR00282 family)
MYKVLFFGDIVGAIGRQAVVQALPAIITKHSPDLIVANVENLAHGTGVTLKTLNELVEAGVDAFTGGNHSWGNPMGVPLFEDPMWKNRLAVPTNYGAAKNGQNAILVEKNGARILVANVMGKLFTHAETTSPFAALDRILEKHAADKPQAIIVDLHAEATAEKEAFGFFADGRVAAVLGTHTHVATADTKILPQGTAYVTDVGRCGSYMSVVGFDPKTAVPVFLAQTKGKYEIPTKGTCEVNAVLVTVDLDTGHAQAIDRIREIVDV